MAVRVAAAKAEVARAAAAVVAGWVAAAVAVAGGVAGAVEVVEDGGGRHRPRSSSRGVEEQVGGDPSATALSLTLGHCPIPNPIPIPNRPGITNPIPKP